MSEKPRVKILHPGGIREFPNPTEEELRTKTLFPGASWRIIAGKLPNSHLPSLSVGSLPEHYARQILRKSKKEKK